MLLHIWVRPLDRQCEIGAGRKGEVNEICGSSFVEDQNQGLSLGKPFFELLRRVV